MITIDGYSKDPNIVPEGIAVTFGKDMIAEKGSLKSFLRWFNSCVETEDDHWLHKCKNAPQADIIYVYVIISNRLYGRCYFGGYSKGPVPAYTIKPDGTYEQFMAEWPHITLAGPMIRAPFKRKLSGFQGFRYTTKLF